jgi:hypothetical protein
MELTSSTASGASFSARDWSEDGRAIVLNQIPLAAFSV